jgi:hypothetical protein
MGTDFLFNATEDIPIDITIETAHEAVTEFVQKLSAVEIQDFYGYWAGVSPDEIPDDSHNYLLKELKEAVAVIYFSDCREITSFRPEKKNWLVTGEMSWGDVSDAYNYMTLLNNADAYTVITKYNRKMKRKAKKENITPSN